MRLGKQRPEELGLQWCPSHERWEHPEQAKYETGKMSMRMAKREVQEPFAVATWQAQQMGYSDFSEGSPGRAKRDEIAESLKKQRPKAVLTGLQAMRKRLASCKCGK